MTYSELLPSEGVILDPFLLIKILNEVACAVNDMRDFVDPQEFKVLNDINKENHLSTSAQIASPRKKPSMSLHAPTISTVSSSSLPAFSASSGSFNIPSTRASVLAEAYPEPPDESADYKGKKPDIRYLFLGCCTHYYLS